jgi:type VI secretion system protein ImpL
MGGPELVNRLRSLQQDAATLPPPVANLIGQVAGKAEAATLGQARSELENRYREDVLRDCNEVVAGHYPFTPGSATDTPLADFGRLFGYGGVFDTFFKANLEPLVDTSRSPWTWRAGVSGASVGASTAMLRQFEAARRVREMFFRPGSQTPELHFTLMPAGLDPAATRFVLEIDGQAIDYRPGVERAWAATWPGPGTGAAVATFEDNSGGRPREAFAGPWAWFRLLDAVQVHRETDVRYIASFQVGGHQARAPAALLRPARL